MSSFSNLQEITLLVALSANICSGLGVVVLLVSYIHDTDNPCPGFAVEMSAFYFYMT